MPNEEYLALITSEYADKPLYVAYVKAFLDMLTPTVEMLEQFNIIFNVFKELPSATDPSNPEPGTKESTIDDQLDKIGVLLNASRILPAVIEDVPPVLSNETFQKILRSKILASKWDGTISGLENILSSIYPDLQYEFIDNQDMSYDINIVDPQASDVDVALLLNGYILPKPSGVRVNYAIVVDSVFGWDLNTLSINGWDLSKWRIT